MPPQERGVNPVIKTNRNTDMSIKLDQQLQDLPGLKAQQSGQSWVYALPVGEPIVFWDDEAQAYTEANIQEPWATKLVMNTNRAIQDWAAETPKGMTPYHPPVLREHQMAGWRGGDLLEARLAGSREDSTYGVYLLVDWLEGVWGNIQSGETAHVSIGTLSTYLDSHGREYSPMIQELSITETPRLKNIGAIQDTVSLRLSDALTQGSKIMGNEEIVILLQQIIDRMLAIETALPSMAAQLEALAASAAAPEEIAAGDDLMSGPGPLSPEEDLKMGLDMDKYEMSEDEILEDLLKRKIGLDLAEKVLRVAKNPPKKGVRLNDAPNIKPVVKANTHQARLDQANARGLVGLAAIEAVFGK